MGAPARVRPAAPRSTRTAAPLAVVFALVVVVPVGLALTVDSYGYDIWGAFIWAPALLALCVPLARWAARRTGEASVAGFILGAAFLKIVVGTLLRYSTAQAFYGGLADAARYDDAGGLLAVQFRDGIFGDLGKVSGTRFIEVVSGLVQAVIGETRMGVFFVFSFLGFVGLVLLYVAFVEALPSGDRRLYRLLLFLTPTMWYWPSGVGKEAFMLLCLGAAAFGTARLFEARLSGVPFAALGLWGMIVVRPHMALVFMVGVMFAIPALARREASTGRAWAVRLAPLVLLLALPLAVGAVETLFGLDRLDADSAETATSEVARRTTKNGTTYATVDPFTPAGLVVGTATVFYRPLPWEAPGVQGLASSVEMTTLAVVCTTAMWRRRRALLGGLSHRYARLGLGFTLAFAMAFAAVGNFGILTRQRSLLLPFAFVVVACASRSVDDSTGSGSSLARSTSLAPAVAP